MHFFGESLELLAFAWDAGKNAWRPRGLVYDDTINNFPPQQLPTGEWMMSRRDHRMNKSMLIGGSRALYDWTAVPIAVPANRARLEEPDWWTLKDGSLAGLFRDSSGSKRLYRAFSTDRGRTWTTPVRTNYPDATSKFFALRTSKGNYVLVSNANPAARNPLCLATSDDGLVFTRMAALPIPGEGTFQYPHVIEHDGQLLIAFSRDKRAIEVVKVAISDVDALRAAGRDQASRRP